MKGELILYLYSFINIKNKITIFNVYKAIKIKRFSGVYTLSIIFQLVVWLLLLLDIIIFYDIIYSINKIAN